MMTSEEAELTIEQLQREVEHYREDAEFHREWIRLCGHADAAAIAWKERCSKRKPEEQGRD